MADAECNACKKNLGGEGGAVRFPCPKCLKQTIRRCTHCRKIAARYACPECGFEGPN